MTLAAELAALTAANAIGSNVVTKAVSDVAEGPHLVLPVGDWVVHTAVAQPLEWQRFAGSHAPRIWVCCDQPGRHHLPGVVDHALTSAGLEPATLGLEITERQPARRADAVAPDLVALRGPGVGLAADEYARLQQMGCTGVPAAPPGSGEHHHQAPARPGHVSPAAGVSGSTSA